MRLDNALVDRQLASSRSRARDSIKRSMVKLNGTVCTRPSQNVTLSCNVEISDPASKYVSRAALKLLHALDHFKVDITGCIALDIGASTGGFSQVLLERGAKHVFALDVGEGQLADKLRSDERITLLEKTNARDLDISNAGPLGDQKIDLLVSDVSFISLKLALPPALQRATNGARAVFLVKPQFEVGKENIGKNGIVTNSQLAAQSAQDISNWLETQHDWTSKGIIASPIKGSDGNSEYLLAAEKNQR